ncbi:MAG TPA: condensation domain-containing protein, partial [Thermoanaerobaculia bacterium]|nr:condensation domain-containing protein [Thermoanaerobaculia bacterium]
MSTPDTDLLFFDCSSAQRRLWFLDQLEPGNPFYNVPAAVRLEGVLDVAALEAALRQLVQRHEVLRTTFRSENGEPVQVVHPELPVHVAREDLSSLPREEAWERARALARQEALAPFRLDSGPLLRVKLARLGPEEHVLLLTLHHIVSDGWSIGVLVREVGALYEAHQQGREARLPELPIQYADYAHWQREWLASDALKDSLSFWKQSLASPLPVLELPTDRPRPPVQTFRGAHLSAQLPGPVLQRLKALGQQEGSTLFMVLLGAFSSLLYRYSHQEDVVVGTPVANRGRGETEGLIGFFVNLLPLRVDLSSNPSFLQLLQRVRQSTLQAFAHQDVPFEKLVEEVQPARDSSRGPLFQSMLVLQNAPTGP